MFLCKVWSHVLSQLKHVCLSLIAGTKPMLSVSLCYVLNIKFGFYSLLPDGVHLALVCYHNICDLALC